MGWLIDGVWSKDRPRRDDKGRYQRSAAQFRDRVTSDRGSQFAAQAGRYHLYASLACPWSHRTIIARSVLGLDDQIGLTILGHFMGDDGWSFSDGPGCQPDPLYGARHIHQLYTRADPRYTGRCSVPVLWDRQRETIVNNESVEIMRMFAEAFATCSSIELFPPALRESIDNVIEAIYDPINNGVYKAGFGSSQLAHEEAVRTLFAALDHWDRVLDGRRYLCGASATAADLCLFTTLIRFDAVYYTHFKCNLRHVYEYPNLGPYTRDIYQLPGIAETCNFEHIKQHYYRSHESIDPKRIVPLGPELDFDAPHDRGRFI